MWNPSMGEYIYIYIVGGPENSFSHLQKGNEVIELAIYDGWISDIRRKKICIY